jgi:hypothetical protein
MLDEYGNPIGQLTVNMGKPQSFVVADTSVDVAQDAALADSAEDLPGISPAEIGEYYPGYDDDQKRDRAKRLVIIDGMQIAAVASSVGVPERTVLMWAANFKWADARRRELSAKDDMSRLELAETRIRKRNEVFQAQLEQAEQIRDKATADIHAEKVSLKSGTEAWAAAAKTEQTILGLSEAGKVASADGKEEDGGQGPQSKGGKQPLVAVIVGGGLPPIRRPE